MAKQKLRISEVGQDRLILELAQQYGSRPIDALKEYTTNAIDAIQENDIKNGLIKIILDPVTSRVIVQDNALGMSRERLHKLPVSIGESAKFGKTDLRGEKGVGLLAFGSIGNRMYLISRQSRVDEYGYIMYEISRGGSAISSEEGSLTDREMDDFNGPFNYGTQAVLDVERQKFNQRFKSANVKNEIQEIYWPLLDDGNITFSLQVIGNEESRIQAIQVRGENIFSKTIPFTTKKHGENLEHKVNLKLWFDPETDSGKISVYSKGVRVYRNITELDDENLNDCELWKCRQIKGYIDEPDLTLTLGRDKINIQRESNAYKGFIDVLKNLDEILWPVVEQKIAHKRLTRNEELLRRSYNLLKTIFQDSSLEPLYKGFRPEVVKPGKPKIDWGIEGKKSDERKRRWPFGMPELVEFEKGEEKYRSKLEVRLGVPIVAINVGHSDYKNIVESAPNSEAAEEYVLHVLTHPMAAWESQKALEKGIIYNSPEERIDEISRRADDLFFSAIKKKK